MSLLVDRAVHAAGLGQLTEARRSGDRDALQSFAPKLAEVDLLIVGALADQIREEEVGAVVRIYANAAPDRSPDVVAVHPEPGDKGAMGLSFLRRVATGRILGPRAGRVRIDWSEAGLELAQVALGFGASELVGPIANRRGLPILAETQLKVKGEGLVSAQSIKKKELAGLIRRAGREPVFETGREGARPLLVEGGHA
jgi:hypothetical protein